MTTDPGASANVFTAPRLKSGAADPDQQARREAIQFALTHLRGRPFGSTDVGDAIRLATWVLHGVDPEAQIGRLATFIAEEIPGEPSRSEGAVDTAIRLLRKFGYAPDGGNLPDRAPGESPT